MELQLGELDRLLGDRGELSGTDAEDLHGIQVVLLRDILGAGAEEESSAESSDRQKSGDKIIHVSALYKDDKVSVALGH